MASYLKISFLFWFLCVLMEYVQCQDREIHTIILKPKRTSGYKHHKNIRPTSRRKPRKSYQEKNYEHKFSNSNDWTPVAGKYSSLNHDKNESKNKYRESQIFPKKNVILTTSVPQKLPRPILENNSHRRPNYSSIEVSSEYSRKKTLSTTTIKPKPYEVYEEVDDISLPEDFIFRNLSPPAAGPSHTYYSTASHIENQIKESEVDNSTERTQYSKPRYQSSRNRGNKKYSN